MEQLTVLVSARLSGFLLGGSAYGGKKEEVVDSTLLSGE